MLSELQAAIDAVMLQSTTSSVRLGALADFIVRLLAEHGLQGARGGKSGELRVPGLARAKDWDVAYEFAGKFRLLVSLKSMWSNASGTVPNRLDDHMGEVANVQQLRPEIVIGYVVIFDIQADSVRREDGLTWSEFFKRRLSAISIRRAPMWNQGLLEGFWFIRIDSRRAESDRIVDPDTTMAEGVSFAASLIGELQLREPAVVIRRAERDR